MAARGYASIFDKALPVCTRSSMSKMSQFLCAPEVLAYIMLLLLDMKATFVNVIFNDELYNREPLETEQLPQCHMYKLNKNPYKQKRAQSKGKPR